MNAKLHLTESISICDTLFFISHKTKSIQLGACFPAKASVASMASLRRFSIARELAPAAYRPETCLRDSAVFSRELSDGGRGGWHA